MNQSFLTLRNILAKLYEHETDSRRVAADAGVDISRIAFGSSAINTWHSVLVEAEKSYQMDALLQIVEDEYGVNSELCQACTTYRHNQGTYFSSKSTNRRWQGSDARRPIPDYLPYMVNRDEQEEELSLALNRVGRQSYLPVLCVAYGDEYQCHDMFIERLKRVSLPKILNLNPTHNTITAYRLPWPTGPEAHKRLQTQLALTIGRDAWLSTGEVNRLLAQHPNPVLLHIDLFDEEWQRQGGAAIQEFLHFWQQWPPLTPGQRLFICLCIRHRAPTGARQPRGIMHRLPWFKPAVTTDAIELLMREVRAMIATLAPERLLCVPLPKLTGVERKHVHRWANSAETQIYCRRHVPEEEILNLFDTLERQLAATAIPMARIAKELEKLLTKYSD